MKRRLLAALIAVFIPQVANVLAEPTLVWPSLPDLHLRERERIVAFSLQISGGTIRSYPRVPSGWFISIVNDPGSTEIRGNAQVGAAALSPEDFKSFVGIQKLDLSDLKLALALEVVVTADFEQERHLKFAGDQIPLSFLRAPELQP